MASIPQSLDTGRTVFGICAAYFVNEALKWEGKFCELVLPSFENPGSSSATHLSITISIAVVLHGAPP